MLRRRLTALLASLLLLPSMITGGREGCIVDGQHAHAPARDAHYLHSQLLAHEADTSSPLGVPHAPAQCILVAGCGAAVVTAAVIAIEEPAHAVGTVDTDVALTPDSPALGIEPPPPRV